MTLPLVALIVATGVCVGTLSALFGVGGGLLLVPLMVLALGAGQHLAEGTSLLVIVPTAVAGTLAHRKRGYVSAKHAAVLAAGGIAGVLVGASLALRIDPEALQVAFGILVLVMGARQLYDGSRGALRARREPAPPEG